MSAYSVNRPGLTLRERIAAFRWALPLTLSVLVFFYQLGPARWVHNAYDHAVHYVVEIIFYATVGPYLTYWAMRRIEGWLDEKERAERVAQESQHRLVAITSASADAILGVDSGGRIESWNRGAALLFGYAEKEIVGRPFTTLLQGEAGKAIAWRWLQEAVVQDGFVRGHEATCVDADGCSRAVELTATRLEERGGRPAGMSIIMRDITRRKQREEEIRHLNASLNRQVAERTRELAEKVDELARANSDLQKLDKTRSEFVSLVSHQIRAPLTNMRGAMERIVSDCPAFNPTCGRMFSVLENQVLRLDDLVQDVLTSDRLDAGEFVLHREPVSVGPVLKQVVEHMQGRKAGRSFLVREKPGLPIVFADRERLADVVANLLDNADKYAPANEAIIVEMHADDQQVTVSVRDFGAGLPPADLERIFERFYRTDSSDSQTAYGYGLGLYICRRLIEAQGGLIWAENHPGGGAVFSFSLPVWEGMND